MSYYYDKNGNLVKKEKKKNKTSEKKVTQTSGYYYDENNNLVSQASADDDTEKRTWFNKGAFDDGYQFGDVTKTILGTTTDIRSNLIGGALEIGEGFVDTLAYLGGAAAQISPANASTKKMLDKGIKDFIKSDLYNGEKIASDITPEKWILNAMGKDYDEVSVIGEKADSLAQSTGQLAGTIALQAVGVPWFVTTGTTSFGGEVEQAFNEGADYAEAGLSAAITAGAEILTEKLSGGIKFGGKTLDDVLLKPLTEKISNKALRTLVNVGFDAVGEGSEEVISGIISNLGTALYKEETLSEILASEEAIDEYVESFIGGLVLGGVSSAGKSITESRSKLTENEQKVVDFEVEKRIAEKETNGKKLTQTEKKAIEKQVKSDLEKGYISTDTIEEVLGGETYKFYKDTLANEEALQKEFDTLNKMKQGEMTGEQIDRRAELKQQLADLKENSKTADMKMKLGDEVFSLVKDSRLVESYNENTRRGQAFEADLSQYDEKYRGTIKKAVESGILNNTRRTHEFVDMVAKISADKGVLFDFANNEKIANSSFAVEGKIVNGFVDGDGNVVLNIDSPKALEKTAGYEITHILEGTELYDTLANTITEYAKSKGDYEGRLEALNKLYEGVYEGEEFSKKVNKELVADLVGDYVFTDKNFIRKLSTENRNIFEKIYDEIKYLCKVATAGSKEARELEKVKKVFAEVYRESGKVKQSGKPQSNITETTEDTSTKIVDETTDKTDKKGYSGNDGYEYFDSLDEETSNLHNTITINGISISLQNGSAGVTSKHCVTSQFVKDGEVVIWSQPEWFDSFEEAKTYASMLCFEAEEYDGGVTPTEKYWGKTEGDTKYSLSDSEGKQLSKEQQDFFKDSKMRDDNGNLKVMYHGTAREPIINDLTKREISEQSYTMLDRLAQGELVTLEELDSLPEVIEGKEKVKEYTDKFLVDNPEFKDVPVKQLGTHLIDSEERERLRNKILQDRLNSGSFTHLDKDGNEVYNGSVAKDKRLDIVIGLAAAGKSSSIVNPLSQYFKSAVVDSDIIKKELPEFYEGWGASLVHEESSIINAELFDRFTQTGTNIVLPIVGAETSSVENYINLAKAQGYDVHLHLNELNGSKAMGRMLRRYFSEGRFIPPEVSWKNGDKPTAVYEELINRSDLSGYSHWNNDVPKGQRPVLKGFSGSNRALVEYSRAWRASGATDTESGAGESTQGENQTNQIAPIKETSSTDGVFFDAEKTKYSLSEQGETVKKQPGLTYGEDIKFEKDIAPTMAEVAENTITDDIAPYNAPITEEEANAQASERLASLTDEDAPPETVDEYYEAPDTTSLDDKALKNIGKSLRETLSLTPQETKAIQEIVQEYSTSETPSIDNLFETIKEKFGEKIWRTKNEEIGDVKRFLRTTKVNVSPKIKSDIADYKAFRKSIGSKLGISKDGLPVDIAYMELVELYPEFFSDDIWNETEQFLRMVEVANTDPYIYESYPLDDETIQEAVNIISNEVRGYKENLNRIAAEETAQEALDSIAPAKATQIMDGSRGDALLVQSLDNYPIKTVEDRLNEKIRAVEASLADNKQLRREAMENYNKQIAKLSEEYAGLKNKSTKKATNIVNRVINIERLKATTDADYAKRISDLEARVKKMNSDQYSRAMHKQDKMQEHAAWAENLLGDTSTWVDKKIGLQYATNTERRNLRDIVRDADGNVDIAKADAIDDAINGQYNREEAAKKRELAQVRGKYAELKITKAEDTYVQMLGELRYNPGTTLTEKVVNEYYEKHKNKINKAKVEKVLKLARQDYDNLLKRVNEELKKQGMKEIPYRQGYFPHFTEPRQNFIQKLLNWKTQDNEIPTSIAGLTEDFKPVKKYQSFDKQRHGDTTDYSFLKGFDNYSDGALDWIYHLDTLQKRRAVENHIRFTHSEEGIKKRIKEVYANEELDANEAQAQIEHILSEAENPLNNFVQDFTTHTNILAGKKNSLDRAVEQSTNRHIYSAMTNVQNRMSANMVLANVRSALTNFIPITQSWAQVSPLRSLQATKDTIANAIKDDGIIDKSTFLTNRLREVDNLYNTAWDKVLDKAGIMFEVIDNFSSQVIWRSKYNQNLADGMTEIEAIKNADQFAENVMAGRSKGNEPTLFNAKNPLVKALTMFQLEVNNQYGYLLKDVPNDLKAETNHWKLNLAKGYTTAFIGAYVYNALMEQVAGSGAALDPIGIIEDLLRDLGLFDDEEEKESDEVVTNLVDNVVEELPFVSGLFGGGRIPIASALPYGGEYGGGLSGAIEDISEGNWKNIGKELMNPILNIGLPVGGGQIKKTVQGLGMFNTDEEHPIAGSYTDSGDLRFPVEDTVSNRIQAGVFGQWANKNARDYIENGRKPLSPKNTQEFIDVELPIADYWDYREGMKGLKTNAEKADYINNLDIQDWQKNLLMNNILDRKEDVDMSNYDDYGNYEEFDYAQKNPEKYAVSKAVGGYEAYKSYSSDLADIKSDKDLNGKTISGSRKEKVIDYINSLEADYNTKIILYKIEYPSDNTYNHEIINYLNNREDISYDEMEIILKELGFRVESDGTVYWD